MSKLYNILGKNKYQAGVDISAMSRKEIGIRRYIKTVDKQLTDVSPEERKEILSHLDKKLKLFLKKSQKRAIVEKLGDPVKYGKALNRHYKVLRRTDEIVLAFQPTNTLNGKNGNKRFLREMKFVISADMIMPIPTKDLWVFGGISAFLIGLFVYILFVWKMWTLVWVLSPAFIANSSALLSRRIKFLEPLDKPVDLGMKCFDGKRVLGDSKTIRGFLFGILASTASGAVIFYASQYLGIPIFPSLNYALLLGAVLGIGALIGDAVKSFFKRRVGIHEGKNFMLFDQFDFLIGAILISLPFVQFPLKFIFVMFLATFVAHIMTNIVAFYLRVKKVPW